MSGKPSPDGVRVFMAALGRFVESSVDAEKMRREIAERQELLKRDQEAADAAYREMFELMDRMDVRSSGNTGFEGRFAWFISELYRQLTGGRDA